jgi:hypothetical protein
MMVVKVVIIRPKLTPEKKEIRGSLIFWGKRFGRPKKKYLGLGQPRIFIYLFFCIDQDYLFFLLAIVRPDGQSR